MVKPDISVSVGCELNATSVARWHENHSNESYTHLLIHTAVYQANKRDLFNTHHARLLCLKCVGHISFSVVTGKLLSCFITNCTRLLELGWRVVPMEKATVHQTGFFPLSIYNRIQYFYINRTT